MDTGDLEAAGLYDPAAPNADERLATLLWLVEQGASLDQLVHADAEDRLAMVATELVLARGDLITLIDVAHRTGLSVERIEALRRSVGLAYVDPNVARFTESDVAAISSVEFGTKMFGDEAAMHFGRVLGTALARIAEASASLFLMTVERPLAQRNAGELEMVHAHSEATQRLVTVVPMIMESLLRAHMDQLVRRVGHPRSTPDAEGIAWLAVGFVDLVGFTPLSGRLTGTELMQMVNEFEGRSIDIVTSGGGRVVKLIGDEVMFTAVDAAQACEIALALVDEWRTEASKVQPRGGVSVGEVLAWGGDVYGPTVNLASRVAELAVRSEILVTSEVRDEAGTGAAFDFEPAGRRTLKGFDEPVPLFAATRSATTA